MTIDEILDCLDANHQRATFGAVASILSSGPRGPRNVKWHLIDWIKRNKAHDFGPKTSWVVHKNTGEPPPEYDEKPGAKKHPDLHHSILVLETGEEIRNLCQNTTRS